MIRTPTFVLLASLAPLALTTASCVQAGLSPAQVAELRAEQAAPREPVAFDAKNFDRFVGAYQLMPSTVVWITRDGSHDLARSTGQVAFEIFPESQTKFFSNEIRAQYSFDSDAGGHVIALVMHQLGMERRAPRISAEAAKAIEDALLARIRAGAPSPGTEAALRHQIEAVEKGAFDTAAMTPEMAALVGSQAPSATQTFAQLGALKSLTFKNVAPDGFDIYDAVFERGRLTCRLSPLVDGKIKGFRYLLAPQAS
jgi:hypothetical protein